MISQSLQRVYGNEDNEVDNVDISWDIQASIHTLHMMSKTQIASELLLELGHDQHQ
jgi:hypothetical protein